MVAERVDASVVVVVVAVVVSLPVLQPRIPFP